jgi:hypothetical protein
MTRPTDKWVGLWKGNGDVASRAHDAVLNLTSAGTMQFWIYPFITPDLNNFPTVLCKGAVNSAYQCQLDVAAGSRMTGRINVSGFKTVQDTGAITRSAWNSFMVAWDTTDIRLYRAGSSTAVATTATGGSCATNSNPLRFGDGDTLAGNTLRGMLFDVRLFNVKRTGAQYAADYNVAIDHGSPPSGLVANWLFSDPIGKTIEDLTANNLDVTLAQPDMRARLAALPY